MKQLTDEKREVLIDIFGKLLKADAAPPWLAALTELAAELHAASRLPVSRSTRRLLYVVVVSRASQSRSDLSSRLVQTRQDGGPKLAVR